MLLISVDYTDVLWRFYLKSETPDRNLILASNKIIEN